MVKDALLNKQVSLPALQIIKIKSAVATKVPQQNDKITIYNDDSNQDKDTQKKT